MQAAMRMARNGSDSAPLPSSHDLLSEGRNFRNYLKAAEVDLHDADIPLTPPSAEQQLKVTRSTPEGDLEPLSPSPERGQLSEEERRWRRMTYPAGRIYHLVPARLVFGALQNSGLPCFHSWTQKS